MALHKLFSSGSYTFYNDSENHNIVYKIRGDDTIKTVAFDVVLFHNDVIRNIKYSNGELVQRELNYDARTWVNGRRFKYAGAPAYVTNSVVEDSAIDAFQCQIAKLKAPKPERFSGDVIDLIGLIDLWQPQSLGDDWQGDLPTQRCKAFYAEARDYLSSRFAPNQRRYYRKNPHILKQSDLVALTIRIIELKYPSGKRIPVPQANSSPWIDEVAKATPEVSDTDLAQALRTYQRQKDSIQSEQSADGDETALNAVEELIGVENARETIFRYHTTNVDCLTPLEHEEASQQIDLFHQLVCNNDVLRSGVASLARFPVDINTFQETIWNTLNQEEQCYLRIFVTTLSQNLKISDYLRYHVSVILDSPILENLEQFRLFHDNLSRALGLDVSNREAQVRLKEFWLLQVPQNLSPKPIDNEQPNSSAADNENTENNNPQQTAEISFTDLSKQVAFKQRLKSTIEEALLFKQPLSWQGNTLRFRGPQKDLRTPHGQPYKQEKPTKISVTVLPEGIKIDIEGGVNPQDTRVAKACLAAAHAIKAAQNSGICGPIKIVGDKGICAALKAACQRAKVDVEKAPGATKGDDASQSTEQMQQMMRQFGRR